MEITAARGWFMSIGGRKRMIIPAATLTGVADEGLPGVSRRPVRMVSNNAAYWIKIQLPSRQDDLVYVTLDLEHEKRLKVSGAIGGGQILGPAATAAVLNRRNQIRRLHPLGYFAIAFDLPEPVELNFLSIDISHDGTVEVFLTKAHAPPPSPPLPEQAAPESSPTPPSSA